MATIVRALRLGAKQALFTRWIARRYISYNKCPRHNYTIPQTWYFFQEFTGNRSFDGVKEQKRDLGVIVLFVFA